MDRKYNSAINEWCRDIFHIFADNNIREINQRRSEKKNMFNTLIVRRDSKRNSKFQSDWSDHARRIDLY